MDAVFTMFGILSPYEVLIRTVIALVIVGVVFLNRTKFTSVLTKWFYKLTKIEMNEHREEEQISFQKQLQWIFVILALQVVTNLILPVTLQVYLAKIPFSAIYLVLFAWGATNLVDVLSHRNWNAAQSMNQTLLHLSFKVIKFLIWAVVAVMILDQFGYNINGLLAGLGLGGLAVALAAQDTVSNLFGCAIIVLDQPFEINDWIQTPDIEGIVEEISFRSTRIRTFQNALVSVPNSSLSNSIITNWSKMERRKLRFYVNLTYSTTKEQIQAISTKICDYLNSVEDIVDGSASVFFEEMSSSSLDLRVDCVVNHAGIKDFLRVREQVNYAVMDIVNEEGAGFAFPSQSIYIESMPK